ncbi:MAG: thymidylate synthase [Synechococcaceae cyanobacterium RL_1_2]|nr:thymidylate synthase [Synechococcaceae cyanobacterium RL_1_2]
MVEFTPPQRQLLKSFVTNLDRPLFGLWNLPEVVKGALFSRYSRSTKSLREILLEEFINDREANFAEIVGQSGDGMDQFVAIQKAEKFYNRVLIGYGDDSVAELGGAHLACEGISNIAAKALEDSRIGLSPLEKSTRYVAFDQQVHGQYLYYREPAIMASRHGDLYEQTLDHLFTTYRTLIGQLWPWVQNQTPREEGTSDRAYNNATRAKTLDLLRGLLPMATLTNVGLFGNGRAFEYLLVKLQASHHQELQGLAASMQQELEQMIPSFVKRASSDRGRAFAHYLQDTNHQTQQLSDRLLSTNTKANPSQETVQLVEYDPDGETKVITAILYSHSDLTWAEVMNQVEHLTATERLELINTYVGDRAVRFHKPGRGLEETYYTFDVLGDLGAYRDLQRHRILTQERQRYTVDHGYIIPHELVQAELDGPYCAALDRAADTYRTIAQDLPWAAQYVVPFAYRIRWRMKLNLRELYHFAELRSGRQGHPTYRAIAQDMYKLVMSVHPTLAAGMKFVDLGNYELERLASEQKIDQKLSQLEHL